MVVKGMGGEEAVHIMENSTLENAGEKKVK